MKKLFVTKLAVTLVLLITLFSINEKVYSQVDDSVLIKKSRNTIGVDLLSFSYARSFVVKERWAFGTEISIGVWGGKYSFSPLYYTYCDQGCTTESTRFIGEIFKIKPFIRVNYYKNNFVDIGLNLSSTMLKPVFFDSNGTGTLNFASGLDVVIVYGWEKVKLGTELQLNIIGEYNTKNDTKVSHQQIAVLWTPIKLYVLF